MAVRPYWWCQWCGATHDSSVVRCVQCGATGLTKPVDLADIPPTYPTYPTWTATSDGAADVTWAHDRYKAIAESGPGIAALALKAPARQRPARTETKAWAPYDSWDSLSDAEPGRYGWRS